MRKCKRKPLRPLHHWGFARSRSLLQQFWAWASGVGVVGGRESLGENQGSTLFSRAAVTPRSACGKILTTIEDWRSNDNHNCESSFSASASPFPLLTLSYPSRALFPGYLGAESLRVCKSLRVSASYIFITKSILEEQESEKDAQIYPNTNVKRKRKIVRGK